MSHFAVCPVCNHSLRARRDSGTLTCPGCDTALEWDPTAGMRERLPKSHYSVELVEQEIELYPFWVAVETIAVNENVSWSEARARAKQRGKIPLDWNLERFGG